MWVKQRNSSSYASNSSRYECIVILTNNIHVFWLSLGKDKKTVLEVLVSLLLAAVYKQKQDLKQLQWPRLANGLAVFSDVTEHQVQPWSFPSSRSLSMWDTVVSFSHWPWPFVLTHVWFAIGRIVIQNISKTKAEFILASLRTQIEFGVDKIRATCQTQSRHRRANLPFHDYFITKSIATTWGDKVQILSF